MMTAAKLAALIRNTGPVPTQAISKPAMAGPVSRAVLNEAEFNATALEMLSCPTSSETNAWRDGASMAPAIPRQRAAR